MKSFSKKTIILIGMILITISASAQKLDQARMKQRIDRIDKNNIEALVTMINDQELQPHVKQLAVERLGDLTVEINQDAQLFDKILNPLISASQIKGMEHALIRDQSCRSLGKLAKFNNAQKAIPPIKELLLNDESIGVRKTCADNLGLFVKNPPEASEALVAALDQNLAIRKPSQDQIMLTRSIIISIGKIKHKQSFISLMKVLQSTYPDSIKNEAYKTMEDINWN